MYTRRLRLLSMLVLLCLAVAGLAVAEEPQSLPVEESAQEIDLDLMPDDENADLSFSDIAAAEDAEPTIAPEATAAPDATVEPDATLMPEATVEATETPEPTVTPEPTPTYFTGPLKTNTVNLKKKTVSKTVTVGLPYVITVKGGIKSCSSANKKIAKVAKDGTLTPRKPGEVKITVKAKSGTKYTLNLTVAEAPEPQGLTVVASKKHMTLKWTAAEHATGYLVEYSEDGKDWEEYKSTKAGKLKSEVTKIIEGPTFFRVRAILGDHFGGVSDVISVLTPVTDAKVFLEESYSYGPTDHMNVTWTASPGATKYEVYRASLPSNKYKLIGTTKETWFADTLAPTKLYAYKIKPVWNGLEDLPMCDPVNLWTGMQANVLPPSDMTSETGIILLVNKKAQVVTAYIKDSKGRYRLPLRHMICSTGLSYERTRNGVYTLLSKRGEWYTYPGVSGDTIRWPSVYRSGYYFHSPLYNVDHTIRNYTVRRLGQRASAGCVRLKSNEAEWVYKNCPVGTTVYICDGKKKDDLKKALEPKTVEVKGF